MSPCPARGARALPAATALALAAAACSAPVVDDVIDATAGSTQALVHVDRTVDPASPASVQVSAKFMRLSPVTDPGLAERLVGSPLELPAPGACATLGEHDEALPAGELGSIELLDVGDVALVAGSSVLPLAARAFPDVGDLVSGVVYTSRDAELDLPATPSVLVRVAGSAHIDAFELEASTPSPPAEVTVNGEPLEASPLLESGAAIAIEWLAGREDDLVYVEVSPADAPPTRCAFVDGGRGVLPERLAVAGRAATLSVHRLRRNRVLSAGIDGGEVRFDVAVAGLVAWGAEPSP